MRRETILAGFAMFAMFFGSGNIVFPLSLGRLSGEGWLLSMLGFFLTAVFVPFLGLAAIVLLKGSSARFFSLIGRFPGLVMQFFILALIGPFGVIPRCIGVSYGAFKTIAPTVSSFLFIACFCAVLWALTMRREQVIPLIGKFLTPIKLSLIGALIVLGIYSAPLVDLPTCNLMETFQSGVLLGYQTMDLIAAVFFAAAIMGYFRTVEGDAPAKLLRDGMQASLIGATLLTLVYISFLYLGAKYAELTCTVPAEEILPTIAQHALGPSASIIFCITIIFSCLTTAVALTTCWLDGVRTLNWVQKFSYHTTLLLTLGITLVMASLGFSGIVKLLSPLLQVIYPVMIIMAIWHVYREYQFSRPAEIKEE